MEIITENIKLSEIDDLNYEGYIWASNSHKPEVYTGEKVSLAGFISKNNPFIQEGYLYSSDSSVSISIKHFDGHGCIVVKHKISKFEGCGNITEFNYLADPALVRADRDIKKLKFIKYWKAESDSLCEELPVLKPSQTLFMGFEYKNGGRDND